MTNKKKVLDDGLTNKQRILRMVERWDDDIPFEQALYHMSVMQAVMEGLKDLEEGRWVDHDELFDELERLCDEEENQTRLVDKGGKKLKGTSRTHHGNRLPKNGEVVRMPPQKVRRPAS